VDLNFLGSENKSLFGVFDGHGGREVAVYCSDHYGQILSDKTSVIDEQGIEEWLRRSFLDVDTALRTEEGQTKLGNLRREKPPKKSPIIQMLAGDKNGEDKAEDMMLDSIGATSNVIYIDHEAKKIYVANAGDSRCTMGKKNSMVEMSVDHKPECEVEIARITKAGSTITDGRVDGNLNLTRSLGDLKYKSRENLTPEEQAITANPDTLVFDLDDEVDFIIMGCDGIWEKKSNEEMVSYVYDKLKQQKENNEEDYEKIVRELLLDSIAEDVKEAQGVGCDNMTCILIVF
jgi:serine/threonine protein phosphatase PrpC